MGLQYTLIYKKGIKNGVADSISRKPISYVAPSDMYAISSPQALWLQDVVDSYSKDSEAIKLLQALSVSGSKGHFTLKEGIIMYKNRIWLPANIPLQKKIIYALQSSSIGGHSGIHVTYTKIKGLFAWKL